MAAMEEGGLSKGWRRTLCWGWIFTLVGVVLPDAPHLLHLRQGFRRITLQHADLDACVCVCIQTLKRSAAEALDGIKKARRTKRHYSNITI